jgi:hypothetical protein
LSARTNSNSSSLQVRGIDDVKSRQVSCLAIMSKMSGQNSRYDSTTVQYTTKACVINKERTIAALIT